VNFHKQREPDIGGSEAYVLMALLVLGIFP